MKKLLLMAAMALLGTTSYAQYTTDAPANGFDINGGKDYVVFYAPQDIITRMGAKIKSNQCLDPESKISTCDYWGNNPDLSLCNAESGLKNSWGSDVLFNVTPTGFWGGSGTACFRGITQIFDLSMLDDDHILHIGFCNSGVKTSTSYEFAFRGAKLQVINRAAAGALKVSAVPAIATAPSKAAWKYIEISVADLKKKFPKIELTKGAKEENFFTFAIAGTKSTVSSILEPGAEVKTYDVTNLQSALGFDSFFFYKKDTSNGINDIQTSENINNDIQAVYDLSGRRVENPSNGVYVVKTAKGTKKVILK